MLLLAMIFALILQNPQQNRLGTIEGVVTSTNSAVGPITGARVKVWDSRQGPVTTSPFSAATTTDAAGHFAVTDVPAGVYEIEITHEAFGYRRDALDGKFKGTVTVREGQSVRVPDVSLSPSATISGRILDPDERGVPSAVVEILRMTTDELGRRIWSAIPGKMVTDEKGTYRKKMFGSGDYYVRVEIESGFVPLTLYFPGTEESSDAAPVLVSEGSESVADIRLGSALSGSDFQIAGKVVLPSVDAVSPFIELELTRRDPKASVAAASADSGGRTSMRANDGTANFKLSRVRLGDYELSANARIDGRLYAARVPIEIRDRDIDGVELVLRPPVEVKGRLIFDGEPKDIQLSSRTTDGGFNGMPSGGHAGEVMIFLNPRTNISSSPVRHSAIVNPTDNSFSFGEISEGDYRLNAVLLTDGKPSSQDFYIADVRSGGRSVIESGFRIGLDAVDSMEVVVGTRTGSIEGRIVSSGSNLIVTGSETSRPVLLVLIPEASRRSNTSLYRSASLPSVGYFHVDAIPPGNYKVFAVPQLNESIPFRSTEFINRYESRALSVGVQQGMNTANLQVPYLDK